MNILQKQTKNITIVETQRSISYIVYARQDINNLSNLISSTDVHSSFLWYDAVLIDKVAN
jgi:hypothetical protein